MRHVQISKTVSRLLSSAALCSVIIVSGFAVSSAMADATGGSHGTGGHSGGTHGGTHGGGHDSGGGHDGGHDDGGHEDGGHDDDGHEGGHAGGSGEGSGGKGPHYGGGNNVQGGRGHSLEDRIFREGEAPGRYGRAGAGEGGASGGGHKGDLFGDMYVILRDDNGVPILDANGFVQPLDVDGALIPLDDEGHPIDESLTVEVELGRLNVARAPERVLEGRLAEVVGLLNSATKIEQDAAGRLVVTSGGSETTIDSPLENLAIYQALMNEGTLEGLTVSPSVLGDLSHIADGVRDASDISASYAFLAAASDKTQPITVDRLVYLNRILGIEGGITGPDGASYSDFGSFGYDRASQYDGVVVEVLVQQGDGSWTTETVNVFNDVFGGEAYQSNMGAGGFAQAADDARLVIDYLHTYEEPTHETH